jgi:hypothetical protein
VPHTYFALRLDGLGLALAQLPNTLTPPKDVAHSRIAHTHHAHRYQVSEHGENDIISITSRKVKECASVNFMKRLSMQFNLYT